MAQRLFLYAYDELDQAVMRVQLLQEGAGKPCSRACTCVGKSVRRSCIEQPHTLLITAMRHPLFPLVGME